MYSTRITRENPTSFIFLLDQSSSMLEPWGRDATTDKATAVATVINRMLLELVAVATKPDVRNYYDIGIIGYGATVGPCMTGPLAGKPLVSIVDLHRNPARIASVTKKEPDGAGGLVEVNIQLPVWIEPVGQNGTPMAEAFRTALRLVDDAATRHPRSFPPVVINITDGQYTDESPTSIVDKITNVRTADGSALVLNVHISSARGEPVIFPSSDSMISDGFGGELFHMSSILPAPMLSAARDEGLPVQQGARGFAFNSDLATLTRIVGIGTIGTVKKLPPGGADR